MEIYTDEFLKELTSQEEKYQFVSFTHADAKRLGEMLYENSKAYNRPVGIVIRINQNVIYCYMPDGTNHENAQWLTAKANTVEHMEMSSLRVNVQLHMAGENMADKYMRQFDYTLMGGGFPVRLKNVGVIGTICVSGLPHIQDHQLIIDTLKMFLEEKRIG